jgi:uncharacterized membrane protein YdjX (TVP38/TMEM64 family)
VYLPLRHDKPKAGKKEMHLQNTQLGKRLSFVIDFVGVILFIGHELELHLPDLETWVQKLGTLAPLGFIALFVILSPIFASVDALCFAAGLLFSIGAGEIYVIIATYLAAAVIFYIGRYLLRDRYLLLLGEHKQLVALNVVLSNNSFKLMCLLRLTPLLFAMLSYALSVTQVKF